MISAFLFLVACTPDSKDSRPPGGHQGDDTGRADTADSANDSGDSGDSGDTDTGGGGDSADTSDTGRDTGGETGALLDPPLNGTSGGSGGVEAPTGTTLSTGGTTYQLLAPRGTSTARAVPLLLVYSGTEGSSVMTSNMRQVQSYAHLSDALIAVLDGQRDNAADGEAVLDDLRMLYDIDNDRTWLLSESAGTTAGLDLGFHERQSMFAAYWVNDVNARDTPEATAAELGFAPWGNVGPGGDDPDANAIVAAMRSAGYQLPEDAPYSGSGSDTHGSTDQFLAAVSFFSDKSRE